MAMTRRFFEVVIAHCLLVGFSASCSVSTAPRGPLPTSSVQGATYPTTVEEFVQIRFFHGVPFDAARSYGAAGVDPLLVLLQNPKFETAWPNAVTTLGMIGDPRATAPLIAFVSSGDTKLSPDQYRAKTSAVMALGYISNLASDPAALDYLTQGADPVTWQQRTRINWSSPFGGSAQRDARALAEVSILGLALSGKPAAAATLQDIQRRGTDAGASPDARRLGALAGEALREHEKIARLGLQSYYGAQGASAGRR
jgi:hypothetical protein